LFVEFGESAMNFSIRVFVSELGNRLPVTHALHVRLEHALREHKITIPFPQRDINLRREHQEAERTIEGYRQAVE